MSTHVANTAEWYVKWLEERYPDWTPEQRSEIAANFAQQQAPPLKAQIEPDEEETPGDTRADERKDARRRSYLTEKELNKILAPPPEITNDGTSGK